MYLQKQVVNLEVDESSFTGETTPCCKSSEPKAGQENVTIAFMGTYVCGGHGKVRVCGLRVNSEQFVVWCRVWLSGLANTLSLAVSSR